MKVKFSNATEFRHLQQREPKLLIPYHVYLRDSKIDLFFFCKQVAISLVWMLGEPLAHIW